MPHNYYFMILYKYVSVFTESVSFACIFLFYSSVAMLEMFLDHNHWPVVMFWLKNNFLMSSLPYWLLSVTYQIARHCNYAFMMKHNYYLLASYTVDGQTPLQIAASHLIISITIN